MVTSPNLLLLVIEDSDEDFETFQRILRKENQIEIPLRRCCDGDEALNFLYDIGTPASDESRQQPTLILLDLNLPGIDGRDVLLQIKQDDALKHIPIVILTTSSNPKDIEICYRYGANSYMLKPTNIQRLRQSIKTFIDYWLDVAILPSPENSAP